jgi:hypothetical protein
MYILHIICNSYSLKGKKRKPTSIQITKGQDRFTQRKKDQTIALSPARLRKKVILIKLEELMGQHYNPW